MFTIFYRNPIHDDANQFKGEFRSTSSTVESWFIP